jgi:glycosyltransferase involved in cell wall biosynthesis
VVDASCGIRLPAENPTQYAAEIAAAIRHLVTDRRLRLSLGDGARRRAADIAFWPRKVDRMDDLYRSVLGSAESGRNSPQVGHPYETGTEVPSV